MTKCLYCSRCGSIRSFLRDGGVTACDCGLIQGWWVDAAKGIARLYTETLMGRQYGRIIGMHNGFIQSEIASNQVMPVQFHRQNHTEATHSPGYLFDESMRSCWAVIILPGLTYDTGWASPEEFENKLA